MPVEWIMAIAVLLIVAAGLCWFVRSREKREKAQQVKAADKAAKKADAAAVEDAKGVRPDIPVWRDKPTGIKE